MSSAEEAPAEESQAPASADNAPLLSDKCFQELEHAAHSGEMPAARSALGQRLAGNPTLNERLHTARVSINKWPLLPSLYVFCRESYVVGVSVRLPLLPNLHLLDAGHATLNDS